MKRYIDKSVLIAEIEKRIKEIDEIGTYLSPRGVLTNLLCHLDTLEVKETNSVWHDAIELPDETSLILLSLKDGNFILADEKTAYIRELVDKWCYVSDI